MMPNKIIHEFTLKNSPFRIETGEIANHAQSALVVRYGETTVLITVSVGDINPELDFFPLTIDYVEKLYAGGIISSSPYIKREGRPTDHEILSGRLIDHAIRSLFPKEFRNEVQVICQVISYDKLHDPVLTSIIGVSFALEYSGVPFFGPYGASRVAMIDDQIVINPSLEEVKNSSLSMYVSSVKGGGIVSVEAESHDISEDKIKEAILKAVEENNLLIAEQEKFVELYGKKSFVFEEVKEDENLFNEIWNDTHEELENVIYIVSKIEREIEIKQIKSRIFEKYEPKIQSEEIYASAVGSAFEKCLKKIVRKNIIENQKRPDGRDLETVRNLTMRVGILPQVHGSALFTRGETQTLTIVTLGTDRDALMAQNLEGDFSKNYFHHYNMPGYANGEVDRRLGFPNRRAIGHGDIGERALVNMIPSKEEFPYTIRVVSEVTSSNGSTSMAATCSSALALMDAGVPVKKVVGGIGVGLVFESEENYKIVTDIIGMEDFYGDMDFKITGSKDGVTAIQLDNKMSGIPQKVLFEAIDRSKQARLLVIGEMEKCLPASRPQLSKNAPRFHRMKIDPEKIGELIGPGGKNIRNIIEKTNVEINIDEDRSGNVVIYSKNDEDLGKALAMIKGSSGDLDVGNEYDAEVVRLESYGAFIEIAMTNIQGLLHISNLGLGFVKDIHDVLKLGQKLKVKFLGRDEKGRNKFINVPALDKKEEIINEKTES